jgi:hypothetical protein
MTAAFGSDRIEVTLAVANDRVADVSITARRPPGVGRFAQGRPADMVATLLPRIFALCATAQGAAVTMAIAAARDAAITVPAAAAAAVLSERLLELLRGTVTTLAGPDLAGCAPALRALADAVRPFDAALLPDAAAAALAIEEIERGLAALGLTDGCLADADSYARWIAGGSPLAGLARAVCDDDPGFGAIAVDPLAAADDLAVGAGLAQTGVAFAARPQLEDRVPETGALARQSRHPLMQALGSGLWPRLLARLIEVRATPARLRALLAGAGDAGDLIRGIQVAPGVGLAAVECARGRLHHLVALNRDGRIDRLEIVAPTEWNFHPQGPLARALTGIRLRDVDADRRRIEHLIAAFDPCVASRLSIREAADA